MSDAYSALPIRTELFGQTVYQDAIFKLGDATNPTTQQAAVDIFGSQFQVLKDISGNAIGDQLLSASYWLQVVSPATGPASPGTAASYADLAAGIYNSTPPTLTNGQQSSLQLDSSGNLKVDLATSLPAGSNVIGAVTQSGGPWTSNITEIGGSALALGQTTMSASIPVTIASNQSAIPVTQSGSWTVAVTQSTTPWVTQDTSDGSVNGGTAGTTSTLAGGVYNSTPLTLTNGQQASLQLTASGALEVALAGASLGYDTNYGVVGVDTLRTAAQIGNATGAADFGNGSTGAQTLRVAANLAVAGADVSNINPVPVALVSSTPGTAIQDYHTSAALAAGASVTFTYTVAAGHTFNLERVWASSAVQIKAVVNKNGSPIFVGFASTATRNIDITVVAPPIIAAGNTVTVTITNIDLLASDVYCTIEGNQN